MHYCATCLPWDPHFQEFEMPHEIWKAFVGDSFRRNRDVTAAAQKKWNCSKKVDKKQLYSFLHLCVVVHLLSFFIEIHFYPPFSSFIPFYPSFIRASTRLRTLCDWHASMPTPNLCWKLTEKFRLCERCHSEGPKKYCKTLWYTLYRGLPSVFWKCFETAPHPTSFKLVAYTSSWVCMTGWTMPVVHRFRFIWWTCRYVHTDCRFSVLQCWFRAFLFANLTTHREKVCCRHFSINSRRKFEHCIVFWSN